MKEIRVKISTLIENQIPQYLKESSPLLIDFLRQYYISIESKGQVLDLLENIDQYVKLDRLTGLKLNTILQEQVSFFDTTIRVESTFGFPESYGLIKINNEIISYETKNENTFINCYRGFSGVESYTDTNFDKDVIFSKTNISEHSTNSEVQNLSLIFLQEFLTKTKKQFLPGFEERDLVENINQNIFIKQSKDFYSSKGTISSFKILFNSLYGERVSVIKPSEFLLKSSDSNYLITKDLVVEALQGNPEELSNQTLFQNNDEYVSEASAPITKVERIFRNNKEYYILSLDFDYDKDIESRGSILGNFEIHPKTRIIGNVKENQNFIDVDSTIGFPNFGVLVVNQNGIESFIQYKSKTLNQFFECQDVPIIEDNTDIRLDTYAYGYSSVDGSEIRVRIGGVLSDLDIKDDTFLSDIGDTIKIISPGKIVNDIKAKNWIYNVSVTYDLATPPILETINTQRIVTIDEHNFVDGDSIIIEVNDGSGPYESKVLKVNNKKSLIISPQVPSSSALKYKAKRNLSKCNFLNYSELNDLNSNVQNIYIDDNSSLYVASPSIPNYSNNNLRIFDGSVAINGPQSNNQIFIPNHPFLTGDIIFYSYENSDKNLGIPEGSYVIKKINQNFVKFSKSVEDIFQNIFVNIVDGEVVNNKISFFNLYNKKLKSQKLLRKIQSPEISENKSETPSGFIGIFNNGIEILNYKSKDYVYYGPIEDIGVISDLQGYDIISPNKLEITDSIGIGASALIHVTGNLKKINLIDPGFDYIDIPKIKIQGGNGEDAAAKANLISFSHRLDFNSSNNSVVDLINNTITFFSDHKFRDIEQVVYTTNGNLNIGGLIDQSMYTIKSISSTQVKLFNTVEDAINDINSLELTSLGEGIHSLTSTNKKKKIGSVFVENSGFNYSNKRLIILPENINVAKNTIFAKNHGYDDGEVINYSGTNNSIGGVQFGNYYVKYINQDEFSLINIVFDDNNPEDFDFKNNTIVNFINSGTGQHYFNYPNINVTIDGIVGVNTFSSQTSVAEIQPIFTGKITNVFLVSPGKNYGSNDIINFERQPQINLVGGSGCLLKPIILNGRVEQVVILNSGNNYNSPPNIEVIGSGKGAVLTPILDNGNIIDVKIISKGIGYFENNTEILVNTEVDGETKFKSKIKYWNVNNYFRYLSFSNLFENNAILTNSLNIQYELQYAHLALPDSLRKISLISKIFEDNEIVINDKENDSRSPESRIHSPIVGWAYDGNPIYGPYGFDTPKGGIIRRMRSGYILNQKENRPNLPQEFFVEDYEFVGNGDLDENNGRYSITPEFPNGVYAYFCTINDDLTPSFPFIIGNFYKSKPIDFNFDKNSNQDDIDISKINLIRNTKPYNLTSNNSEYSYVLNPNKIKNQNSNVSSIQSGTLDFIKISFPGVDYKVGEKIILKSSENDFGSGASAEISKVDGKKIVNINSEINIIDNVEFSSSNIFDSSIGFAPSPHNLNSEDFISICDCSNDREILDEDFYTVKVFPTKLSLRSSVGDFSETGFIAYFDVYGNINYPYVSEDDIFIIGSEKVKILSIDFTNKRIKVLRGYESTAITNHLENETITEIPRKFYTNTKFDKNYKINRKYYFDPQETVGIGTTSGIGVGVTLTFSNPGIGITQLFIPTRSLYIPNHNLNTGDKLIYNTNSGIGLSVSNDGIEDFILEDNTILYAAKISNDLVGISSFKVGLSNTGEFIGIGITSNILYFNSLGEGDNHSLTTLFEDSFSAKVNSISVTVNTSEEHLLKTKDKIITEVFSEEIQTYTPFYDFISRSLCFDKKEINLIENNLITITKHEYKRGQKLLFNSFNPSLGLSNGQKYYAIPINTNQIKLSNSLYGSLTNTDIVNIGTFITSTPSFLSLVNPPIIAYKNNTIIFDLSDDSLEGFDFDLYSNKNYSDKFFGFGQFEIEKNGTVGEINSNLKLKINSNFNESIYYNLSIPNKNEIFFEKLQYFVDDVNIKNNNTIFFVSSEYSGEHSLTGVGNSSFTFNLKNVPENLEYINEIDSKLVYKTNSKNALGPISNIKITSKGRNYKKLPIIEKINSRFGKNALLELKTSTIGKITKINIKDIGFDYFSDTTLKPSAKIPEILRIDPLSSLDNVTIISFGQNYNTAPNLVLIDGLTKKIVSDVILDFSLDKNSVNIIKNTKGINNITPLLIPINNSNGTNIFSIEYNESEKEIIITLNDSYSSISEFPFEVGDRVLIENTNIIQNSGKSYNSSNYDYSLFDVKEINPQIGGENPNIILDVSNFTIDGELFGIFDFENSFGTIVPEKYFPKFEISLKKNIFFIGEKVISNDNVGFVEFWDSGNELLKINTSQNFEINTRIVGETSKSIGNIIEKIDFESNYKIDSTSIVIRSWQDNFGFLNNDFQRIHDNYYYQYFSYSLKSRVQYEDWESAISSLNHTSGFKKFSDLDVEIVSSYTGIQTSQNFGDVSALVTLDSIIDIQCRNDYDLVSENSNIFDSKLVSDQIFFESRELFDYFNCIGNRVLSIDDISNQFRSTDRFNIVNRFIL
jgi:hypothetical protein